MGEELPESFRVVVDNEATMGCLSEGAFDFTGAPDAPVLWDGTLWACDPVVNGADAWLIPCESVTFGAFLNFEIGKDLAGGLVTAGGREGFCEFSTPILAIEPL